jgi:uncharacterized linocin/CFP29 family protein
MSDVQTDFIVNDGQGFSGSGSVASRLLKTGDYMSFRPFIGSDNREYIPVWNGKYTEDGERQYEAKLVANAGAVLRADEWKWLDQRLVDVARPRLQLINSMQAAGMVVNFPDAYSYSIYQYERVSDIDDAVVSMKAKSNTGNDRSVVDLVSIPLPLIHKEFQLEAREIAIARKTGQRLPTHMLELCGRKVAEAAEKLVLGTWGSYTFGSAPLYGIINFPGRNTGNFLNPTVNGWTPAMMYNSVLQMLQVAQNDFQYGPFDLYYSPGLMRYMLADYTAAYSGPSLLDKIKAIPALVNVQQLDYLPDNRLVLIQRDQMTASVLRGMDLRTVQWSTDGGETINFRVMAMLLPLLRTDQNGNSGIVDFTGSATTV